MQTTTRAATDEGDPVRGLVASVETYLGLIVSEPIVARALLIESLRAGQPALEIRARTHRAYERLLEGQYAVIRDARPGLPALPATRFVAAIAATNELAYRELERGSAADVAALAPDVIGTLGAMLGLEALRT
jgi:hypothetical protein